MLGWSWKTLAQGKTREYFLKLNPVDARVANLGLLLLSPLPNAPRLPLTFFSASSASRLDYGLGSQRPGTGWWCFWRFTPKLHTLSAACELWSPEETQLLLCRVCLKTNFQGDKRFSGGKYIHKLRCCSSCTWCNIFQGTRVLLKLFFSLVLEVLEGIYSLFLR